ncbi:MAG: EAL domain-containing protein [Rhodoferax sp.]|nr:EAL domain-containing protein [Rhodoferax sp.]
MRIAKRLWLSAAATVAAVVFLVPVLVWNFSAYVETQNNDVLVKSIHDNFFERASFRDRYFLHREDRFRLLWDESKLQSDQLLRRASSQFRDEAGQKAVEQIRRTVDETALVFHRVVDNTPSLKSSSGNREVFEELDKRLYSQLLLKATDVRNAIDALQESSSRQVQQSQQRFIAVSGALALLLAVVIVLNAVQIGGLIRRRLALLHEGANRVTSGNLAYRIVSQGADEFSEIANTINLMMDSLAQRKEALKQAAHYARSLLEASLDPLVTISAEGKITDVNEASVSVTGVAREALIGTDFGDYFTDPVQAREGYQQVFAKGFVTDYPLAIRHSSGRITDVLYNASVYRDEQGRVLGVFAAARDVTERKKAESFIQAASVFTYAREGIIITDTSGTILNVNDSFTRITGYGREEVLGQNPRLLKSGRQDDAYYVAMWRDLIDKGHWYGEIWNKRKNGEIYAEMLTITAVYGSDAKTQHYVALFTDITKLKEHQNQLEHMAHFDALTGLPNRLLLSDRLHQGMASAERRAQTLALAYLDLDGFKSVNDQHGHETGDQLLIALASRMKQGLREGDTLARIGGDEFVAVLIDLADGDASVPMLNRLLTAAAQPVQLGDLHLQVSASIGVTFYPQAQPIEADQLLRQADQAMYQAKLTGRRRYHVFDAGQDSNSRVHFESLERIRLALSEREFVLHYQPKVNMRSGKVVGAEALIRWQHPQRGQLVPALFLPVIEDDALAIAIGEWVIETALTQFELWRVTGLDIPVSVNVGARQLQQADFLDRLRLLLAAHRQLPPSCLELEILETSALEDVAQVSQLIELCAQLGIDFALDDFGTGYSSLTYLKRLRVNTIKIDQSFVQDMLDDPDDLAILQGVIGLASAFKRQVIAEGVETVAHGTLLLQLGCELAQGYGIAHPMPGAELPDWVRNWKPDPAWGDVEKLR